MLVSTAFCCAVNPPNGGSCEHIIALNERRRIDVMCNKGFDIKVLKSNAGCYIGTLDHDGSPYCRLTDYFESERAAQAALDSGNAVIRKAVEIEYCSKNNRCLS